MSCATTAAFYNYSMKDLGITNKADIFCPSKLTNYVLRLSLKVGDLVQVYYNNNHVPNDTIYIWNGECLEYVKYKWDIVSINKVGPAYFTEYDCELPDLCVRSFEKEEDGCLRATITLGDQTYIVEYTGDAHAWAINDGDIPLEYMYCPKRKMIIASDLLY
jgi:hypothetical protein